MSYFTLIGQLAFQSYKRSYNDVSECEKRQGSKQVGYQTLPIKEYQSKVKTARLDLMNP